VSNASEPQISVDIAYLRLKGLKIEKSSYHSEGVLAIFAH
jgi:hypothetical protein